MASDDMYRWFDHKGDIIEAPTTEGRPTCWRDDGRQAHWMFGQPSSSAAFQAMTLCGKRAFEVPGRGEVDCPECRIHYLHAEGRLGYRAGKWTDGAEPLPDDEQGAAYTLASMGYMPEFSSALPPVGD